MKLLDAFRQQVQGLGPLKRAWFTTFNLGIPFFETHVLPVLLEADAPANRMDYENMQQQLAERGIDVRVFCDVRMMEADQLKRTAVPVHGVLPGRMDFEGVDKESLFHPKVIFLEDANGRMVLGAGSANLSVSGWGQNQEVFAFRTVSSNEQYQQIKRFFEPLLTNAGLGEAQSLGVRRRFEGDDADWHFVHSLFGQSFLHLLLEGTQAEQLAVWSPYFSRDLAGLLVKVRALAGADFNFSIVPDRVNNQHIRTKWTRAIEKLLGNGTLIFHDRPSPRASEIKMTHAKIWLATGQKARLAIGSWNCTGPGSASFEVRNVEAGILLDVPLTTRIVGSPLKLGVNAFCSDELLKDEELVVPPYSLPFELLVRFDWEQGNYDVQGWLHEEVNGASYDLRLPGVQKRLPLHWKSRRTEGAWLLETIELELADNEALLADHSYEIWRDGSLEYRGLVHETGQAHRRTQGYDSLKDLLNDLVNGAEPGASSMSRLRQVLRHDDVPDDAPSSAALAADGGGLSYFRLFHAFEQFRQRLKNVGTRVELDRLLFVVPGSLQELVSKINEQVATSGSGTVFNWFLLQEADSLRTLALEAHDRTREKYARTAPPQGKKWESLKPNKRAVRLPPEIRGNAAYMRQLREACDYGR